MKYKKIEHEGYNLHTIKTKKFRTVNINLNYIGKRDRKSTVCFELLEGILLYATKQFPNRISFAKACGNLYDLRLRLKTLQWGKYNNFTFTISFINENYTKKGMNKKSVSFALKQFLNPFTLKSAFDKEIFDTIKKLYYEELISAKDNPDLYSQMRIKEEMGKKDLYVYDIEEELKELEKITEKTLYSFYKKVLKEYQLEIFAIGDIDESELDTVIASKIKRKTNDTSSKDFQIEHTKIRQRIRRVFEPSGFKQSKLEMGFKSQNLTEFEENYVSFIYGNILGGGTDSLLFHEVREKKSLCYYIYSTGNVRLNLFQIKSGIDYRNINRVINLSKKCIEKIKSGDFDEKLIERAKKCYINAIVENEDYVTAVLADYINSYFFGKDNMEIRKNRINEVRKEDIINFSKKVHLDTIYVLRGDKSAS